MRAILILLAVSGLLWLVLYGFRSVRAGASPAAEPAGLLMPSLPEAEGVSTSPGPAAAQSPQPAASAPAEPVASDVAPAPSAQSANAAAPSTKEVASPSPAQVTSPPSPQASSTSADEAVLASVLLHHTQDLPAYLEGPGKSLPAGRRDLALALYRLLVGPPEQARRMAEDLEAREGVLVSEATYVKDALSTPAAVEAARHDDSPLLLAASLARVASQANAAFADGKHREAALAFGELLLGEITAPWKADKEALSAWSASLARAQAGYRWNPSGGWGSVDVKVEPGDSLISVRKRALKEHPELLVCTGQIERANAMRSETIHPGQILKVPTSRANVLVDLDSHWALYRLGTEVVAAWEIGVGKPGSDTPPGEYFAGEKTEEPPWFRPGHAPVPYGDPENPLGTRWIAWQKSDGSGTGLGFHGTKDPSSIGEDQSQGCVRMRQAAIEELFEILPKGATITVRP